jgi:hypothetical protein
VFGVIFLDNRHRIIAIEDMFFGTIDGASVHPRVVVERALELHAAAVVLYHNHPSGITEPSQADIRITGRIKEALDIVDVTFRRTVSLSEGPTFGDTQFSINTGMQVYFADPASPWQRGTNENTNGLIRQFFPKGTDFSLVSKRELQAAEDLLNGRPRKCIGYKFPKDVFYELAALDC